MNFFALPKAELHCHLDGSLRAATLLDLTSGFESEAQVLQAVRAGQVRHDLEDYLRAFELTLRALQTAEALERVMYELVVDCAAENVRRLEVRFSPSLHRSRGLPDDAIMDAVRSGMRKGVAATGISCGVIVCAIRSMAPSVSLQMAELAVRHHACGFDLAGPEVGFPARLHDEAFALARSAGLGITVHAGEAEGAWAVASAIHEQGASRVGHGTRLVDDPALVRVAVERGLALEVCLRSNVETQSVPELGAHPFARMLRAGVCVTLNTDNRLMSHTGLSEEYERAANAFSLSREEVRTVVANGFTSAFVSAAERQELLRAAMYDFDHIV